MALKSSWLVEILGLGYEALAWHGSFLEQNTKRKKSSRGEGFWRYILVCHTSPLLSSEESDFSPSVTAAALIAGTTLILVCPDVAICGICSESRMASALLAAA